MEWEHIRWIKNQLFKQLFLNFSPLNPKTMQIKSFSTYTKTVKCKNNFIHIECHTINTAKEFYLGHICQRKVSTSKISIWKISPWQYVGVVRSSYTSCMKKLNMKRDYKIVLSWMDTSSLLHLLWSQHQFFLCYHLDTWFFLSTKISKW